MAAAFSCMHAATARDLAFPDPSYGWVGISADDRLAAATRDSDRINRLGIALPPFLEGPRRDRLNVARDSAHPNATLVVTNCDDSGAGSLRDTIASAASGDTVDLSQLICSTITLTSTYITVLQDDLTITGPGATSLAIDGGGALPLFAAYGSGTFTIDDVTLTNGYYSASYAGGGCLLSFADLVIQNAIVSHCSAQGVVVISGAMTVRANLTIVNSVITQNSANGSQFLAGGAAFVQGDLTVQYSTISDNIGGAFHTLGNVLIENSTISGNQNKNVGAFGFEAYNNAPTALIINSTVSNNAATDGGLYGGGYTKIPLTIYNSTIAFNSGRTCSGLVAYNAPIVLQSSILADNVSIDLCLLGTATVSGANNLITNASRVPPDTIRDCPQLGPLADNGGPTLTHMLRSTSPAIDTGSNDMALAFDQRGTGFPRVFGAITDIGAVEWQGGADEEIFNSGFESICDH
jgi:hypothetical protein